MGTWWWGGGIKLVINTLNCIKGVSTCPVTVRTIYQTPTLIGTQGGVALKTEIVCLAYEVIIK